jgi:hypothetical protein
MVEWLTLRLAAAERALPARIVWRKIATSLQSMDEFCTNIFLTKRNSSIY